MDSMTEKKNLEAVLTGMQPYRELIMNYRCALMEVDTKLEVLNEEFAMQHGRNPFESIKSRIKTPMSILDKLDRYGLEATIENVEQNIFDIAGIRVVCSFEDDIYAIAKMLLSQDDVTLVRQKDYIKNPKPNGYRSLHLVVEIPIFLSKGTKRMKVEIQLRTIAMDFWASLEHKLKYKKDIECPELIGEKLKHCADVINSVENEMQNIRDMIEENNEMQENNTATPL